MRNNDPIKVHMTFRDWAQSNHGTKVSADMMKLATQNVRDYGADSEEWAGGTFGQLLINNGWDPYEFVGELVEHSRNKEISMLYRNECGLSVARQSPDVHGHILERHAQITSERDVKLCVDVFHHANDPAMMGAVIHHTQRLQDAGYDLYARPNLTIQSNPNTTANQQQIIDQMSRDLETMGEMGFDISKRRFKNANGFLLPDLTFDAVSTINDRFGGETYFHTHNTYGHGYGNALAAIEAGATSIDALPFALAEGTGQLSIEKLIHQMEKQGGTVAERIPTHINLDAMRADQERAFLVRGVHSDTEMPYKRGSLSKAECAGSAGGAITSLKSIPGLVANLQNALGTTNWNEIQDKVYEQKTENRKLFGYATNVTPAENIQDMQAASDVADMAQHTADKKHVLPPGTVALLTGQLGRVPEGVDKAFQARALELAGLDDVVPVTPFQELDPGLPKLKEDLVAQGVENPTNDEATFLAMNTAQGAKFVKAQRDGSLEPLGVPQLPRMLDKGGDLEQYAPALLAVAYKAVELYKTDQGHYDGIDYKALHEEGRILDVDGDTIDKLAEQYGQLDFTEYSEGLRREIQQQLDGIVEDMRAQGADSALAVQANKVIVKQAAALGAPADEVPRLDVASLPKAEVSVNPDFASKKNFQEHVSGLRSEDGEGRIVQAWAQNVPKKKPKASSSSVNPKLAPKQSFAEMLREKQADTEAAALTPVLNEKVAEAVVPEDKGIRLAYVEGKPVSEGESNDEFEDLTFEDEEDNDLDAGAPEIS